MKVYLKKYIKKQDLIFLTGGGNLGDAYPIAENVRQDIINTWEKNIKVIFFYSIDFVETNKTSEYFKNTQKIYSEEKNVILFIREKNSYYFAQKYFHCAMYLVPDIVLFCNEQKKVQRDRVVLFCLRNDKEKRMDALTKEKIEQEIIKSG